MTSNAGEVVDHSDFSFARCFFPRKLLLLGVQVGVVDNMLSLGVFSWCRMKHLKSPFNPAEMERTSMICCRTA